MIRLHPATILTSTDTAPSARPHRLQPPGHSVVILAGGGGGVEACVSEDDVRLDLDELQGELANIVGY